MKNFLIAAACAAALCSFSALAADPSAAPDDGLKLTPEQEAQAVKECKGAPEKYRAQCIEKKRKAFSMGFW